MTAFCFVESLLSLLMISLLFVYVLWKVQWSVFWNIWKPEFWYQFHFIKHWNFHHLEKSRKIKNKLHICLSYDKKKDINGMIFILNYVSINFLHVWNQILRFHSLTVKFEWFLRWKLFWVFCCTSILFIPNSMNS